MPELTLKNITIDGYKSIRHMSLELRPLNVLIGANGAGKSNLLSFFKLLSEMRRGRLEKFVGQSGGANSLLFYGAKTTRQFGAVLELKTPVERSEYAFQLAFSAGDKLTFGEEKLHFEDLILEDGPQTKDFGGGHFESKLADAVEPGIRGVDTFQRGLRYCGPFQFHDTSDSATVRLYSPVANDRPLRNDAGNLAAVLNRLRRTNCYKRIVGTIRQIAPWFDDFVLQTQPESGRILLKWRDRHDDIVFDASSLSDGTLRAIALITLLQQPEEELPALVVIDEPELGLHPSAIVVLGALLKKASYHCQVIVATQSTFLLDQFEAEDVVVVDREGPESKFRRLDSAQLDEWLAEYCLSELWEKNVLGGGPA